MRQERELIAQSACLIQSTTIMPATRKSSWPKAFGTYLWCGVPTGAHILTHRGYCLRLPAIQRDAGVRPVSADWLGVGRVELRLPSGGAAPIWCLRAGRPRLRSGPSWCVGPRRLRRLAVRGGPWVWACAVTRSEVASDFHSCGCLRTAWMRGGRCSRFLYDDCLSQ